MQSVRYVVTFGEAMLRLSPPDGSRLQATGDLTTHVAGAEANVAAALAGLGVPCAWASVLPETPLGRRAAAELGAAGVDLELVDWVEDERLGLFFVEQGEGARPTSIWYDRRHSAFARHARWPRGALAGVRYAVLSGVTPALSPAAHRATTELAAESSQTGTRLVIDVNYRARLWDTADARAALEPLLAVADVVVCSAADARRVFSLGPDPAELRARLAPNSSLCVVTRASAGAEAVDRAGESFSTPALETVLVDRLGLGDAFVAGVLCGLIDEADPAEALRRGAAMAALKATVRGDLALVSRAELDAALASDAAEVLR